MAIDFIRSAEFTLTGTLKFEPKKAEESVEPTWIGINFPEVPRIYIGGCGGIDEPHFDDSIFHMFSYGSAHTHMCPLDPIYNSICISNKKWILYNGEPTDLMWHEYGHVLTPWISKMSHGEGGIHKVDFHPDDEDPEGHGPRWQQTMINLGKPHLQNKFVPMPQELFDNLQVAV